MARIRIVGLAAATVWLGLSASPVLADGLGSFDKLIKPQIPDGMLTYKSSKSLGDDGFVLEGVVITPPPDAGKTDKPQPINVATVTVESLDFDSIEKQQPPLYAKIKFDGISGSSAGGFDLKEMTGLDSVKADFGVNYELDPDSKTFTLTRLELNLNGLGKIQTSFVIDGVAADAATQTDKAMADAFLKTADLIYDDHSLLAKAIPIAAVMQGSDPKTLVALGIGFLDGARVGQGKAAQKAIDSLVAYLEDYQKPKGPLHIALNPPSKVSNADLSAAKTADDMVKLLGIEITYSGTRASTPAEGDAGDKTLNKKK